METFSNIVTIIGGIGIISGFIVVIMRFFINLLEGIKCLLRTSMKDTYYKYKDEREIPSYELQNFWHCYSAYKTLKGNSFIDDMSEEVKGWTMK